MQRGRIPHEEPPCLVELVKQLNLLRAQGEVKNVYVRGNARWGNALRHRGNSPLHVPPQHHLGDRLAFGGCNFLQSRIVQELDLSRLPGPRPISRSKGRVALEHNSVVVAHINDVLLLKVRVALILEDDRGMLLAVLQDLVHLPGVEVGDRSSSDEAFVNQILNGVICLHKVALIITSVHSISLKREHRRLVPGLGVDSVRSKSWLLPSGGACLRPMDSEGIHVVELQILQCRHEVRFHVIFPMVRVPQFALNKQLLSFDNPLVDHILNGISDLVLVSVIVRRVNHPISRLNRSSNRVPRLATRRFPRPKTDHRHLRPIGKLHCWCLRHVPSSRKTTHLQPFRT
mmetsp:Transcript_1740/g.2678  ORF Transcript_1740/g.2678 Transcript_1740/m.2678 type:complete len:344 (+) Transcript_1740:212-1243(+)